MKLKGEILFLVIAVFVFGVFAFWSLRPAATARISITTSGEGEPSYTPVERRQPTAQAATWSRPQPQSEDGQWLYDVFTPPRIYINPETRLFTVIPYTGPVEAKPFGVELSRVERPIYRLQLEGYIEENPSDPKQSLIHLHDREAGRSRMVRIGQQSAEAKFRVLDFELVREMTEQGFLESKAVVVLEDIRTGSTVRLESGRTHYESRARFHLQLRDDPLTRFTVEREGDQFTAEGFRYQVLHLDPDTPVMLLERTDLESGEQRRERLTLPNGGLQSRHTPTFETGPEHPAPII